MTRVNCRVLVGALALLAVLIVDTPSVGAVVVYSNDFQTNTAGFNVTDRIVLPSDAVGGVSTYLGRRTPGTNAATLTLTGLTPGATYDLAFDLFLGGTWDGSLVFGPDFFGLTSSSSGVLVNATFRNGFPIGTPTPSQTYSDATPLGDGGLFRTREGADVELGEPIYFFGRGAGNPLLSFTAAGTTETLSFGSVDFQGVSDEFFALDNVVVTTEENGAVGVPGPATLALLLVSVPAVLVAAATRRRCRP